MVREEDTQVSAFAYLLLACFNATYVPMSITTVYLNILQDILDSGADLDYQLGADLDYQLYSSCALWCFGLPIMEARPGSICDAFSACLESRAGEWAEHDENSQGERHFFFSVTKKVLSHGVLRGSNMALLIKVIPVVFPEGLAGELLAISPKASGSSNRRKRDEEGSHPGIKCRKRQKHQQFGRDYSRDLATLSSEPLN
ncbi:hypothetical protein F4782DRAFT_253750 [Xylaria castorea]|nr:hypothetical protein F4782DRAFT_253750 [Xylaria castorea]